MKMAEINYRVLQKAGVPRKLVEGQMSSPASTGSADKVNKETEKGTENKTTGQDKGKIPLSGGGNNNDKK